MTADQGHTLKGCSAPDLLERAANQAELISFFTHDDQESDAGPYGPGVTARATAAAQAALSCKLCAEYGSEHDSHCSDI